MKGSFSLSRLHRTGRDFIDIKLLLVNISVLLVVLTSFKIGRPDLIWNVNAFRNLLVDPEHAFPLSFKDLAKVRDD
ncbi:MAG: hypothetical protein ACTSXP_13825 [Promethearchaeota archaeon]